MSFLKNLKIVAAPSKQLVSPEQHRRNKCVVKLAEQIEMAEAELAGKTFERMKRAWVTENGERKRVERPARIKMVVQGCGGQCYPARFLRFQTRGASEGRQDGH